MLNAKIQAYAKDLRTLGEQLKEALQKAGESDGPKYSPSTCRACRAWSVLSSELNQTSEKYTSNQSLPQKLFRILGLKCLKLASVQAFTVPLGGQVGTLCWRVYLT